MKIVNIDEEILQMFWTSFRKGVTYDNIKYHKKPGPHPFSEKHIFGKTTGVKLTPSLFRVSRLSFSFIRTFYYCALEY